MSQPKRQEEGGGFNSYFTPPVRPGVVRLVEVREVSMDSPLYLAALNAGVKAAKDMGIDQIIGMQVSEDLPVSLPVNRSRRLNFRTRAEMMAAKERGECTGHEPWWRSEYMRLAQIEHREGKRRQQQHRRS